jgi:hypothetical protein
LTQSRQTSSVTARAGLLLSLQITALRSIDFFSSEAFAYQEKTHFPGTYVPFLCMNREQWKRIALNLFKADTCYSILLNRSPLLQADELDVDLPSTFAMWNAHPLPVLYERLGEEPDERKKHKLYELRRGYQGPLPPALLIDDIIIGLCATWPDIWRAIVARNRGKYGVRGMETEYSAIEATLDSWKTQLDLMGSLVDRQNESSLEDTYLYKAHRGIQGQPPHADREAVVRRIESSLKEALTLYHGLSLRLIADTTAVDPVPRSEDLSFHDWSNQNRNKTALIHVLGLLNIHEIILSPGGSEKILIHPICRAALSTAVVLLNGWAGSHDECHCQTQNTSPLGDSIEILRTTHCLGIREGEGGLCRCALYAWSMTLEHALAVP